MARGKKREVKAVKRAKAVRAADIEDAPQLPSEAMIKRLLREAKGCDADRHEASGRKGSLIANACERNHLDRKAFAMAMAAERASVQKGYTTHLHYLHYIRAMGLIERWAEQAEMFERPEVTETAETAETETAEEPRASADILPMPAAS
jgi:hypothetical protein